MNRFSPLVEWNFIGDFARFLQDMRDLQPPILIGINDSNDFTYSQQVHSATPSTQIYHRKVYQHENRPWLVYATPAQWIDELHRNAHNWMGLYLLNEADMSGGDETKRWIDWLVGAMEYVLTLPIGIALLVVNNSVGTWKRDQLPLFKRVFQLCGEHPELVKLGTHEYAQNNPAIDTSSPHNPHSAYDLLDAAKVQKDKWVTPADFTAYSDTNDWIGRYLWVNEYCQANGIPIPRKVISEWGCDYMGDLPADLLLGLQSMNGNVQPRGFTSLERYYQTIYQQPVEHMAYEFYEHAESIYTEDVEAICPFIFSHNSEWQAYNLLNMRTLTARLILRKRSEDVSEVPAVNTFPYPDNDPRWESVDIYPFGEFANFRSEDHLNAPILFEVRERMKADVLHTGPFEESAKVWIPFRISKDGATYRGFIRSDVIGIDWLLEAPAPGEVEPVKAVAIVADLKRRIAALKEGFTDFDKRLTDLEALYESEQS